MPLFPPLTGREVYLGQATLTHTASVALGAGTRNVTASLAGILATDRLQIWPTSALPDGYLVMGHPRSGAGTLTASVTHGPLSMNGTFTIVVDVYAIR